MRASEITEIVKIPAGEIKLNKSDFPTYTDKDLKTFQSLPGNAGFVYNVAPVEQDSLYIEIVDSQTKQRVGYISLLKNNYFPMMNAHQVELVGVDPQRRGEGIAKALYGIYLSILKYPLLAGGDQTPGGRRNWLSLANIPGVTVRGYIALNDQHFERNSTRPKYMEKKFDKLLDNIMSMGGDYLGENRGVHFFTFDVEPGTGELEPVVKKQLKLYGYHDLVNPSLYVVWGGK